MIPPDLALVTTRRGKSYYEWWFPGARLTRREMRRAYPPLPSFPGTTPRLDWSVTERA